MNTIELKNGMMYFLSCNISFPGSNGLHIVSSGCGQGKTTMILEIIKTKWRDGILVVVPTMEAANEIGKKIEEWINGVLSFSRPRLMVLHSGGNRIKEMEEYKSDPLSLADYDVLVITSARIIIDPYGLFLSFNKGNTGKRRLVLIDEMINFYPQPFTIPEEMKDIVTFVDKDKTHHGRAGMEVKDESGNLWYRHCYQDTDAMWAAYLGSSYRLFKAKNELTRYKTRYIFGHIRNHGIDATIQGRVKDFADQTCVILFDGTADCLFRDSDPRLLSVQGKRYCSDIEFKQFDMPLKRKNKEDWDKKAFMTIGKGMLEMLKKICQGGKTLIVTWKSVDVFKGMKNDGMADRYEKEETERKIQYNFPKLLSDCLSEIGVDPAHFSVIYRGSGQDRGSNEYRDYENLVFLGEWHIPDTIVGEINGMFGCKCCFKDYMKSLLIQTICRTRIRQHRGLPVKVWFSSDLDYNLMEEVQKYFIDNSDPTCKIGGIQGACRKYGKPEKKQLMDMVSLYRHDPRIRDGIENEKAYSFDISLDELYKLIPRPRKAKDRYNGLVKMLNNRNITMNIR